MALETLVDVGRLHAELDNPTWRIVDCRFDLADPARGEHDHAAGHIPGALYAHLDRDLSSPITPQTGRHPLPDRQRLIAWLGSRGIDASTQVVAYDASGGNMAVRLWWLLRWLGHTRVAVVDGGWQTWNAAGRPVETAPPPPPPACTFEPGPAAAGVVTTTDIVRQLDRRGDDILLLDVRTGERFRGDAEPIDPVAGHIPGAVNLPLGDNLNPDGRFKSSDQLRAMYGGLLGRRDPARVAAMCGSGVTACHSLLAMEIAGLRGGLLYAGSWSEWIRDPARPVATGV